MLWGDGLSGGWLGILKILMSGLYPKPIKLEWLNMGLAECGEDSLFLKNIPLGFLMCSQSWGRCCRVTLGLRWTEAMKSGELRTLLLTKLCSVRWCCLLMGTQDFAPTLFLTLFLPGLTFPPFLPFLINSCLNLPIGTQGGSWRLNEGCFL